MEPQTPTPNVQPSTSPDQQSGQQPYQYPSANSTPPKSPKKWTTIIIGALLVLAVAATYMIVMANNKKDKTDSPSDTPDASLYHEREGYKPEDYQPKIGDPMALKLSTLAKPFNATATSSIIPSCNIITLDNLQSKKLYVGTNSRPTPVLRSYLDGVGKAPLQPSLYTLPAAADTNECSYYLEAADSSISIDLYQPPLVATSAVQDEITRRYAPTSDIGAVKVFKGTKDTEGRSTYMLRSGDISVGLMLRLGSEDAKQDLLQTAAKNLTAQIANPQGWAVAEYDTPTFKKSIAKACSLISNEDIIQLTGSPASQFADEGLATGTGITKASNQKYYNFIENSCSRANSGLGSGLGGGATFNQKLDLNTTSYLDAEGAKYQMASMAQGAANKTAMDGVGDETFIFTDSAGQNTVLVRKGRFVVEIVLNRTQQKRGGLDNITAMAQKLTPYLKGMVTKLEKL